MRIITLDQGVFSVDKYKQFQKATEAPLHGMSLSIHPFLIQREQANILVDAGLSGFYLGKEKPDLLCLLEQENVQADDIGTILISHFHRDHFSGLFHPHTQELLFPKAQYYIYADDIFNCIADHRYASYTPVLEQFVHLPNVHLITNQAGQITPFIRYQHTAGHMPYHMVFWITEGEETVFYGGDEAPQLYQMQRQLIAKYDHDGRKAHEYRKEWYRIGNSEKWTFLFYHDTKTPTFKGDPSFLTSPSLP